jgi:hypothetical protein
VIVGGAMMMIARTTVVVTVTMETTTIKVQILPLMVWIRTGTMTLVLLNISLVN